MHALATRPPALLRTLVFLLALALSTACSSARTFREAQDAFSQAATIDNATQLEGDGLRDIDPAGAELGSDVVAASLSPALYERAQRILVELLEEEQDDLEKDGLHVPALTLLALCEWRLGEWSAADATATKALETAVPATGRRDYILLVAMPGLIRNDQAFELMGAWSGPVADEDFDQVQKLLWDSTGGALKALEDARAKAQAHPVDSYLILSQLAVTKNRFDAYAHAGRRLPDAVLDETGAKMDEFLGDLKQATGGNSSHPLVQRWASALNRPLP